MVNHFKNLVGSLYSFEQPSILSLQMSQGLQPPLSQEVTATLGPQLLGHVRSLDAASAATERAVDQAIDCLQRLIAVASRQGILQNDIKMAESLLMAINASTTSSAQHNASRKRRSDDDHEGGGGLSATLPIQLVMTAILRILSLKEDVIDFMELALLTTLASDLIRAVVHHSLDNQSNTIYHSICIQAESEWIHGSAKSLLYALIQTSPKFLRKIQEERKEGDTVECVEALTSCLYAGADLIRFAGTRLSRSQAVLSTLESIAWDAMACRKVDHTPVATLLAVLPLAGGTERATPASQWTKYMENAQGLFWMLLQTAMPISQRIKVVETPPSLQKQMVEWSTKLQRIESQNDRCDFVSHLSKSLVALLMALLRQGEGNTALLESTLNIPSLLDLVDALLAIPMSAEATYYGSKKRLRDEPLENAVLSPASIATQLANHLYTEGQQLLLYLVNIMGGPSLLPYAKRLRQVGFASILTSCSPTLRQVLEPSYNIAKKRRWLPHSLVARTSALRTLQALLRSMGIKATSERFKTHKRSSSQEIDRVVKVVSGCLLEQIYPNEEESLDWGSTGEKGELINSAANCLSTILLSGGEFLTMESRQLTDSVAAACLVDLTNLNQVASSYSTSTVESFIELGKACITTSWPDGAASSLRDIVRQAAVTIIATGDSSLMQVASSACQLCDTLSNPCIPALYVITRQQEDPPLAQELTAKLDQARADAKAQMERKEEEEQQRKKAKLEKKHAKAMVPATSDQKDKKAVTSSAKLHAKMDTLDSNTSEPGTSTKSKEAVDGKTTPKLSLLKVESKMPPKPESATSLLDEPSLKPKVLPKDDEESDLDEDFPMIVDAAPDDEDADDAE